MTARKKKGITIIISNVIGVAIGAIIFATTSTPSWVPITIQGISMIAGLIGFKLVFPDTD